MNSKLPHSALAPPICFVFGLMILFWSTRWIVAQPVPEPIPVNTLFRDFNGDGVREKLVSQDGVSTIYEWHADTQAWMQADYGLPAGTTWLDRQGHDAGLRFVDLNGDGFDDVLFSNSERLSTHLWNKNVRPDLGWVRGWSQLVRSGARSGAGWEIPSLVNATHRIEGSELVLSWPGTGTQPSRMERRRLLDLIAFDMPPPKTPEQALASFRVRPGFRVELVAAEPIVIDPVSFDWGADGRLWVVEMRDYPLGVDGRGKPGGVVKVLEDLDGDGRYEKMSVFLEGLSFPSSVMPWRKGVLIAAAPDLIYAEDTDGDGRADARRVLFTGFTEGNQQHRFNGFEWGLDGWVYVANGDGGGTVKSVATGKTLSIRGRDLRLLPDTGEMETVSAQTQYGRRRDDWGHWFGNNNPTWLWHVTLPEHYLRRNPRLAVKSVLHVLANYEDSTRVYPVSAEMVRPNQPWSLNHVTSGCSPCPYRDDLFGLECVTSVFANEPVHNAIHREVLERRGTGFVSRRAVGEERSEFLASTDNWFRPVTTRTGPDGALYVADMYRFVLEHPEWISPEMLSRLDTRAGTDKGRIYRVVPEGRARRSIPNLAKKEFSQLVVALDSPNGWTRDMAQRLIVERGAVSGVEVEALGGLLEVTHAPQVRVQTLATLGLLGKLSEPQLIRALADPHAEVRCEALRQSEPRAEERRSGDGVNTGSGARFGAVAALASDSDPFVRLQAAFSLGAWPLERAEPVLRQLSEREDGDPLLRVAILSSLRPDSALFAELNASTPIPKRSSTVRSMPASSPDRAQVIAGYAGVDRLVGDPARGRQHFQALCLPCHRLRGEGHEVGPDLGMVGAKPVEWLMTAILDPNQAVEARYRSWRIDLKSGDVIEGLVSLETANNIVVRVAGGMEQAVLREDILAMVPSTLSLMPNGFEVSLKPQDMADLIRWIKAP